MMYWHDHGMNGWGVGLMALTTLLLLGLLVAAAVILFRYLGRPPQQQPPVDRRTEPEHLLAERLARGEIEPEEYHRRLDALRGKPGAGTGGTGTGGAGRTP